MKIYPKILNIHQKLYRHWFHLFEMLSNYRRTKTRFKDRAGYFPDINRPRSFNEKIFWKKLHDRNPLLPITADKYRVRNFVKNKLKGTAVENVLIPLLHVTSQPETIPFDELPDEYIIKANHSSGGNIIIDRNNQLSRKEIIAQCKINLEKPYGFLKYEWAYAKIPRKILIEKLIRDETGNIPRDYKFHMVHGKCQLIQVDLERHIEHKRSLFTPNWQYLNATLKYPQGPNINPPVNLKDMLSIANVLSTEFDFVRVDLYSIKNKIYFGELTHYPGSGMERFTPRKLDYELGKSWHITPKYWEQKNCI